VAVNSDFRLANEPLCLHSRANSFSIMKSLSVALLLAVSAFTGVLAAAPLPTANPARVGISPERLDRMHKGIQAYIDQGKHAGAIAAIARNGKLIDFTTYGYRDLEKKEPMTADTIVRIYSMSKVITSVAVLQLFEEGHLNLTDPVQGFIPEFKGLKVCTGGTVENPTLVDATNTMTIKHLLTHTAGFGYEFSARPPVNKLYDQAGFWDEKVSLKDFIRGLSKLPLVHQPGTAFNYGVNTDVLGYVVEVVSGQPLDVYMQEHIFGPLRMVDSGFDVPQEKRARLAKLYENGPDGKLREVAVPPYGAYSEKGRGFPSGGGGLFSTAGDYLRFAQMLLNGGRLDGKQILGKKTVELMMANHLTFLPQGTLGGTQSDGFGLGGSVRLDLAKGNTLGSVGQFGWSGAATTTFNIDPKEKTVMLIFAQHLPFNQHNLFGKFQTLFYQSLVE
jgi:CubicO group peptidase (beta-lactamase class C family)